MHGPSEPMVRFDVFELDPRSGELRKQGRRIKLPEQSFQVLSLLLAHPGDVVTRGDLRRCLWPTATAGDFDSGLNNAVKKLRDALGDSADAPRLIETLPRRGYRFLGQVATPAPSPDEPKVEVEVSLPAIESLRPPAREPATRPRPAIWRAVGILLLVVSTGGLGTLAGGSAGPIRSLVVLPFDNRTGDAAQDYFVDSVSAALTTHLSQIAGLDVISRTTAQQFKRSDTRIPDIGSALNVHGIVEGEVTRSGTNVRIMVKLIRASTERDVWSRTYDGSLSQMISLQQSIAADVAVAAGQPRPQADAQRISRTDNPQAFDAYLQGLNARRSLNYEGIRRAVAYFEEAIKIQPDFGEAHAELALTQMQLLFTGPVSPANAVPKAETHAREALRLDPTLKVAHQVLGQILTLYYWQWDEGEESLQRAADLPGGRQFLLSIPLARRGQMDEALAAAKRGRDLDPLSVNAQLAVGIVYRKMGQYDQAIQEFRRAQETSSGNSRVLLQLGVTLIRMGRFADAILELKAAEDANPGHNPRIEAYIGYAYAAAGRTNEAREVLAELEDHRRAQYVSSFGIALIHDALGESELALAALQQAYYDRAVEFAFIDDYPPFKVIASKPRFQSVMQSIGLPR